MAMTRTKYVDLQAFSDRGKSGTTVVQLMMACNDLSLANQALSEWKKEQPRNKKSRQVGAGMYFVRLQLAHLHEGLKIIDALRKDPALLTFVKLCDTQTQESFHKLQQYLPKGPLRKEFEQLVGRVRHNLTFHYDESGKLIENAIADRASRDEARMSSITRGDTGHSWHFRIADDVVDSIVVRQIWDIPANADVRAEADKIADRVHHIFLWFIDFAGEFIWKYCGD